MLISTAALKVFEKIEKLEAQANEQKKNDVFFGSDGCKLFIAAVVANDLNVYIDGLLYLDQTNESSLHFCTKS